MGRQAPRIALALLLGTSTLALAQSGMTAGEAKKKIEAAGYTMVENLKPAGDGYTAVAMKDGKMLALKVDKDGKVEPTK